MARTLKRLVEQCFVPQQLHEKLDITSIMLEATAKGVDIILPA
jgi:hypothetical protein